MKRVTWVWVQESLGAMRVPHQMARKYPPDEAITSESRVAYGEALGLIPVSPITPRSFQTLATFGRANIMARASRVS